MIDAVLEMDGWVDRGGGEERHTLLHDRNVLLCGDHLDAKKKGQSCNSIGKNGNDEFPRASWDISTYLDCLLSGDGYTVPYWAGVVTLEKAGKNPRKLILVRLGLCENC